MAKYKLPLPSISRDQKVLISKLLRQYEKYSLWFEAEQKRISELLNEQDRLDARNNLERLLKTKVVRAVDSAKSRLAPDIENPDLKADFCKAIWLSCLDSKANNFEALSAKVMAGRTYFYKAKSYFLRDIANELGL